MLVTHLFWCSYQRLIDCRRIDKLILKLNTPNRLIYISMSDEAIPEYCSEVDWLINFSPMTAVGAVYFVVDLCHVLFEWFGYKMILKDFFPSFFQIDTQRHIALLLFDQHIYGSCVSETRSFFFQNRFIYEK